jgi:hypothetical protein
LVGVVEMAGASWSLSKISTKVQQALLHVLKGFTSHYLLYYVLLGYAMQKGYQFALIPFEAGAEPTWPMPLMPGHFRAADVWGFNFEQMGSDALVVIEKCRWVPWPLSPAWPPCSGTCGPPVKWLDSASMSRRMCMSPWRRRTWTSSTPG